MKKLLIILVALLWCEISFAVSQESLIKQYLSGRKLDLIEGVWADKWGHINLYAKTSAGNYKIIRIKHRTAPSGSYGGSMTKGSTNYYYGDSFIFYDSGKAASGCNLTVTVSVNSGQWRCVDNQNNIGSSIYRLWPENFNSHNAKFEKKKEPKKKKDKFTPSSGTAFFVTQKGHVITNFHVVEGCKDKSKIVYQDNEVKVKLIAKDKYLDLALLKADIENEHYIVISNKSPKKLQRIIAAGYPFGKELSDDLKFTSGIISSLKGLEDDSTRLQIDAALNYGNSGGPIVDEKTGELVAVAVSGLAKEVSESINFGIKAGSLRNFLDSNQINTSLLAKNFSFGNVDLSSILENATVYTFCN